MTAEALAVLATLTAPGDHSPEAQFLRQPRPHDDGAHAPLRRLADALKLTRTEVLITALAAAVETDLMCGRAIAHLQAPLGGSRPTLGLMAAAFGDFSEILSGNAFASGLLQTAADGAPLAERSISVPAPLCLALERETDALWPGATLAFPDVPLPPSLLAEVKRHALGLSAGIQRTLILRCGSVSESKAAASEIARLLGRRALFLDCSKAPAAGLTPWLLLRDLVPVFLFELGPGERKIIPTLPHYMGPQLALCGPEGSLEADGDSAPGLTIATPCKEERADLWEAALGNRPLADELSSHRHGSGRIAQLGRLARYQSTLEGRSQPEIADVVSASWTAEGAGLEALAQPLSDPISDEALVMTPVLRDELNRILLRCRGREGLTEGLGASASAKYRPGFRALFTGPSGTGKTLACGWIATRLGLPLYRVDLAAVTSKYIGETEKNLAQLLARAEHSEVILLFDEADSMFGKRTDVKESNDRFANAQTNYLLQRIESFDGLVFLTSNSRSRFDPAFFRRLDAIVDFPVPGPMERRSLWLSHLGVNHEIAQREINQLAASADLLGGNIRNAVLSAAVLARAERRPIHFGDVLQAVADEYRKLGRQTPSELVRI